MAIQGQFKQDAPRFNSIINGDMVIWQRGTTINATSTPVANNDDTYICDRWILLSDGNDIVDVGRSTDAPDGGSQYSVDLDVETIDKKFGIAQIIEGVNCHNLIGESCSLSFKAKVAGSGKLDNVKAGIVAWSGTLDSVTSDIVSAWGVEDTNPTLIANATFENTPANLSVTTSWVEYKIENIDIDTASTANVIIFIWSDVTDTDLGDSLYITDVQITPTRKARKFDRHPIETTASDCQRYYQKHDCADSTYNVFGTGIRTGTTTAEIPIPLPVTMREKPTFGYSGLRFRDYTGIDTSVTYSGTYADRTYPMLMLSSVTISNDAGCIQGASATDYMEWDAEL